MPVRQRGPFAPWEEELIAPLPRSAPGRFAAGFRCPLQAFGFLRRHPSLLVYIVVPALINVVLLGLAVWGAIELSAALLGWLWARPDAGLLLALWYVAAVLAGVVLGAVGFVLVMAVAGILATPFNDLLSEKTVERLLGPEEAGGATLGSVLQDALASAGHSLLNLIGYVAVMAPVLLLNLLPGVGSLASSVLGAVATVFFLGRDLLDGPLSARRLSYRQKRELARRERALLGGLGAATALLIWVPVLHLLLLPLGVVGGALLYCRMEHNGLVPEPLPPGPPERHGKAGS